MLVSLCMDLRRFVVTLCNGLLVDVVRCGLMIGASSLCWVCTLVARFHRNERESAI